MQNLRRVVVGDLVHGALEGGGAGGEGAGGDVVLQQLVVDDVDDGGDEGLDVFRAVDEGLDVFCKWGLVSRCVLEVKWKVVKDGQKDVLLLKSRKLWR